MVIDAKKVKKLIREKGFSQKELAEEVGVTPSTISEWINGNAAPSNQNLQILAQLLESSPDDLIEDETNKNNCINNYNMFYPTINIGCNPSTSQKDKDLDSSNKKVSIDLDDKIFEQISNQAQGNIKEFIEAILKKHLKP